MMTRGNRKDKSPAGNGRAFPCNYAEPAPNCHAELVSASRIFPPSCHTGLVPHCHAELVSASHAFCKLKQADKWNNEILKHVLDDISFLSSFLGLTRASSQTIARVIASKSEAIQFVPTPVIASKAKQSSLFPPASLRAKAKQSSLIIIPYKNIYKMIQKLYWIASAFPSLAMTIEG